MELTHSDEQSYQLELHAYWTTFFDFKYKPPSFVFVEIRFSSKVLVTPSMVQPIAITKPINLLRGGTSLEIIPLPIHTFTILVQVATIVNELVKCSERFVKEQAKLVDPSFILIFVFHSFTLEHESFFFSTNFFQVLSNLCTC